MTCFFFLVSNFVLAAILVFFGGSLEKSPTKIWGANPPLDTDIDTDTGLV
jgi:hypothetical protein